MLPFAPNLTRTRTFSAYSPPLRSLPAPNPYETHLLMRVHSSDFLCLDTHVIGLPLAFGGDGFIVQLLLLQPKPHLWSEIGSELDKASLREKSTAEQEARKARRTRAPPPLSSRDESDWPY